MNHIDPIYKEKIKDENLIEINNHYFDIYSLLEWFYNKNMWINPITNLNFRYNNIEYIIDFIIENKILFNFLSKNDFMKWDIICINKFKYIYNQYNKYDKKQKIFNNNLTKQNINKSKLINQINKQHNNLIKTYNYINKILIKYDLKFDYLYSDDKNEFEKNYNNYIKYIDDNNHIFSNNYLDKINNYNLKISKLNCSFIKLLEKYKTILNNILKAEKNINLLNTIAYNKIKI